MHGSRTRAQHHGAPNLRMALPVERAAALLLAALEHSNPDLPEYPDVYLRCLAASLATALARRESRSGFAARVRSLCFNLKSHNHELRRRLCARELSPDELCAMDKASMANAALKAERKATAEKQMRQRTHTNMEGASLTRSMRCPNCGVREALFRHVGATRDGIGKSETWGSKDNPGLSTMLQCCSCNHEWTVDTDAALEAATPAAASSLEASGVASTSATSADGDGVGGAGGSPAAEKKRKRPQVDTT